MAVYDVWRWGVLVWYIIMILVFIHFIAQLIHKYKLIIKINATYIVLWFKTKIKNSLSCPLIYMIAQYLVSVLCVVVCVSVWLHWWPSRHSSSTFMVRIGTPNQWSSLPVVNQCVVAGVIVTNGIWKVLCVLLKN